MAKYLRGIDVSAWEPNINWDRVCAQDIQFAFIKASQADFTDSKFDMHWAGSKRAGILRGAYHFLDPRVDSRVQAETFLSKVKLEAGDLPPVLDLEELKATTPIVDTTKGAKGGKQKGNQGSKGTKPAATGGTSGVTNAQFIACAQDWLARVEAATGRKPIIYSGPAFLQSRMSVNGRLPAWATKYTLWLANYLNHAINEDFDLPWQPNGWSAWSFWQYSDRGIIDGVMADDGSSTGVDLNFFRGTVQDLYALAGTTVPVGRVVIQVDDADDRMQSGGQKDTEQVPVVHHDPVVIPPVKNQTQQEPAQQNQPQPSFTSYVVKSGDTMTAIALNHGVTLDALKRANPQVTNPDLIFPGQTLNIPR